ncbi:hypothetical protein QBC47DRAFT_225233 [Echria macrotheca]|uniref:Uncharacterized protein n=1 Tax=Echria macrotheca TaxID=438768 RepID=A0AAJ0BAJ1_9PEZI|nr:hypothetical protein QBC47DRAFT_225233 [Echria macrotheca]
MPERTAPRSPSEPDMERFVLSSDCECYVQADEVRAAAQQGNPKPCLEVCRNQFLQAVSPNWTEDSGWTTGCQNLTSAAPTTQFWSLYWCDSTFCGVAINQTGGLEQDPNVGLIINTCQNIGFHSVLDPGPPPATYACRTEKGEASLCVQTRVHADVTETAPVAQQTPSGAATTPVSAPGSTVSRPAESTGTPAATHSATPFSAAPTRLSSADAGASTTSGSGLSAGARVAIGVCSALALLAFVALALLCLYRRNRRRASKHRSLRTQLRLTHTALPSGSPTPLISPANSASGGRPPLTPPLRLRERKFLPSILRPGNRSPSPPLTPLTPAYNIYNPGGAFPSSPICSPTTNKLIPRRERHGGSLGSLPPIPPQMPFGISGGAAGTASRGSQSSYGASSVTGHSSLRNEVLAPTSTPAAHHTGTPPSSPTRPPRPHDAPLEIPDLVSPTSPLGPPPNRALPPPPPPIPSAMVPGSTASFTAVGGKTMLLKGVSILREHQDGEDEADYDPRGSWGSWSGTASGVLGREEGSGTRNASGLGREEGRR